MDTPDAIPSRDDVVVVPDYLRAILQKTFKRRLRPAFGLASAPDRRDRFGGRPSTTAELEALEGRR